MPLRWWGRYSAMAPDALRLRWARTGWLGDKTEESELGNFAWVIDPEGNKVELWEPPPGQ